ncbi:unnamed protein product [Prorocentrum cordatum]|uniref:Uncharacterized protein n=1 Tax=Prorocentrum cordatum TaxID=2364126 RepID=A0ABN9U1M0_9DINO|nr:unnamed protein product [Polarella glacialis]
MRECLAEECGWGSSGVAPYVELLGCPIGPGNSLEIQRAAPLARLRERVLALAASPLAMTAVFHEYGRRCLPVLSYKAQLWPTPLNMIANERVLLRRLARCPGRLFKKNMFYDLEVLGGPRCAPMGDYLAASIMRAGAATLNRLQVTGRHLREVAQRRLLLARSLKGQP